MTLHWRKEGVRYEYHYGETDSAFSAQIGASTNSGKYCWTVFHSDFRYAVFGAEVASIDDGKQDAQRWLDENAKRAPNEKKAEPTPEGNRSTKIRRLVVF